MLTLWLRALLLVSLLFAAAPADAHAFAHDAPHTFAVAPPGAVFVASERIERRSHSPAAPAQRLPQAIVLARLAWPARRLVVEAAPVSPRPPGSESPHSGDALGHLQRRRIPRLRDDAAGH